MALTEEEKKQIEEQERYKQDVRNKLDKEVKSKKDWRRNVGCLILLFVCLIPAFMSSGNSSSSTSSTSKVPDQDAILRQTTGWNKSKAGILCGKHALWKPTECEALINNKIWVGMSYEMLVYLYGKPNSVNPSNYGSGNRYQYCWDNYKPSCFYDNNEDGIIDAWN